MMQVFGHLSFENVLVLLVVLEVVFIRPFHLTYFMLEALVEWVLDTGADGPSFVDPVVDQALNYLGHFDPSNGLPTHLMWGQSSMSGQI